MKFGYRFRGLAAMVTAVLYNALSTFPQLYTVKLWHKRIKWIKSKDTIYRNAFSYHMTRHGHRLLKILRVILNMRIEFDPSQKDISSLENSMIIISNHRSLIDIILVYSVMFRLKKPYLRWIIKQGLARTPFGWAGRETNCGFVSRDKNGQDDLSAVTDCAKKAFFDEASVVIFPEGTRFIKPIADSGFDHVRPPKRGGFEAIRKQMPEAPILSLTLDWKNNEKDTGHGRDLLDAGDFAGACVRISLQLIPAAMVDQDPNWIINHWHQKDRALAASAATL